MSLIAFPQEKLVDGVNTANNLTLTLADVVFSKPKDNTSGVYNGETLIRMKARSTGQIDGTSVFGYDRVPLSVLHTAIVGVLPVPVTVTDPYDALPYFHYHYGIGIPVTQNFGYMTPTVPDTPGIINTTAPKKDVYRWTRLPYVFHFNM